MRSTEGLQQLLLEATDITHGHGVEPATSTGVDHDALFFYRHRRVETLLEQFGQAVTAVELLL